MRNARFQPGVSLIESVFAMAILGIVVGALMGALGFLNAAQTRERERLAAMELAHRIVLQYLDDKNAVLNLPAKIEYGPELYNWSYDLDHVGVRGRMSGQRSRTTERFQSLRVSVWLSEESGGSAQMSDLVPGVTLTRVFDPLPLRNPDSIGKLTETPEGLQQIIDAVGVQ